MNIDEDMVLAIRIKNIQDFILDKVKQNGDMSQFNEDVMHVIHALLERQLNPKELTACEIIIKQREYQIQKAKENHLEEHIRALKTELETYKNKIAEIKKWCDAVENSPYSSRFFIDGKEIITDTGSCLDLSKPILEIIDRKEVENGENNNT